MINAKFYAQHYASIGLNVEQAYKAIFGRDMPYNRKVLMLRSYFRKGYNV